MINLVICIILILILIGIIIYKKEENFDIDTMKLETSEPKPNNIEDNKIENKITRQYDERLFKDTSEGFPNFITEYNMYTTMNLNPPDREAFINFLIGNTTHTCKTEQNMCRAGYRPYPID